MSLPDPAHLTTLTFDCYGTLIDWETGAIEALRPLLARYGVTLSDDEIVTAFQDIDGALCEPPYKPYRAVLAGVVEEFGRRFNFPVEATDRQVLVSSVASWRPFPDTVDVLRALGKRYRLAVISNIDDDLFATTAKRLGVEFEVVVTAEQAQSYKPHPAIFEEALRRLAVKPHQVAHVAEGVTEVPTARRLGCATVWVRRHGRSARLLTEAPDLEVPDLKSFLACVGAAGFQKTTSQNQPSTLKSSGSSYLLTDAIRAGLRRATPADATAVRDLTRAAYAKWVPVLGREPKPMTADYDVAVRDHSVDMLYLAGELAALIEMHPETDHMLVVNVAVSPDHQGRGLGRALLAHAEELTRSLGLGEMRLYTSVHLTENVKLYERVGYKVDREEEASPHLGVFVHMSKPLR